MSGAGIRQKKGSVHTIHAYTRLKLMAGIARNDLLRLISASLKEDGIHIQRYKTATKTGKRTVYAWQPELRAAVEMAKQARPCFRQSCSVWIKDGVSRSDGNKYITQSFGKHAVPALGNIEVRVDVSPILPLIQLPARRCLMTSCG